MSYRKQLTDHQKANKYLIITLFVIVTIGILVGVGITYLILK